jgi:hypothetical protein
MRSVFGVRRLAFGGIGIAPGENNCSDNGPSNYHAKIAMQRRNHRPWNTEHRTPNAER